MAACRAGCLRTFIPLLLCLAPLLCEAGIRHYIMCIKKAPALLCTVKT